jgi:two-component system alkaline phosphatase synthesis response regulator PhoP
MRYKILIVDDDPEGLKLLKAMLGNEGFAVVMAQSAREAMLSAVDSRPDLIISDVAMPEVDGVSFCQHIRRDRRTAAIPVILVSGVHKGDADQTEGIEKGADDYLPRPFSAGLLFAKIRAVLRRYSAPEELKDILKTSGLAVDIQARTVSLKGRRTALTRKEFDLLTTFLRKPGRVLSISYLLETVWGYDPADYNDPHTVGVHISSLRKKLGAKLGDKITSVSGLGYRFDP